MIFNPSLQRVSGWWKLINRLKITTFQESLINSGVSRYLKLSKYEDGTVQIALLCGTILLFKTEYIKGEDEYDKY